MSREVMTVDELRAIIGLPAAAVANKVKDYVTVLQRPRVGTVFLIPGRGDTLRVNGTARIIADAAYSDAMTVEGKRPILALEMDVDEVFFHCAKAFPRSEAGDVGSHGGPHRRAPGQDHQGRPERRSTRQVLRRGEHAGDALLETREASRVWN